MEFVDLKVSVFRRVWMMDVNCIIKRNIPGVLVTLEIRSEVNFLYYLVHAGIIVFH